METPMWIVRELIAQSVTLDVSSSGQSNRAVTQIVADGTVFANAAELSSWGDAPVQVHLCEECGIEGCATGGWLVPRHVGVGVAFVPAFGEMLDADEEGVECAPTDFDQGMPVFLPDDYDRLRRWCAGLPPSAAVPVLTGDELLPSLQWEAPSNVLGKFPDEVQLDQDLLLAASDGEISDVADMLERAIRRIDGAGRAWLAPVPAGARAVTLYLDAPGTPEWTALYTIGDEIRLAATLFGYGAGSELT
jgi:hypothetical protein